ncbi:MAG: hypothetical protein J6Y47_04010 [Bacteroidales bacterium]|nr:hypothetical protein [Bacteroidales bacterium]
MKHEHTYQLTTLQKRSIKGLVDSISINGYDYDNYKLQIINGVETLENKYVSVFPVEYHYSYIAYALSVLYRRLYAEGILSLNMFLHLFASAKQENEKSISDYGAFGDLFELLIRIILIGNVNLVRSSALAVSVYGNTDIVSKKYGRIEVGHNGKTFSEGTVFDYMEGNYQCVIYGMFSDIDKELIYKLCINGNGKQALEEIKKRTAIWLDKHMFQYDFNHLGKNGKEINGISIKGGKVMARFDESIYYAFMEKMEDGTFKKLK